MCATVEGQCLEYLVCITLAESWFFAHCESVYIYVNHTILTNLFQHIQVQITKGSYQKIGKLKETHVNNSFLNGAVNYRIICICEVSLIDWKLE